MTQHRSEDGQAARLAIGLGWFSIGLGLAEIAAPRSVARLIGVTPGEDADTLMRSYGTREIANGVAILAQPGQAGWLWSRVAGDALDLGTLAKAMEAGDTDRGRTVGAALAVAGVTALDVLCARQLGRRRERGGATMSPRRKTGAVRVTEAITINKPIDEVYAFWRRFENFPRFMRHLESVQSIGGTRSRWRATAPAGTSVEWEAEIVEERENELLSWRTVGASEVNHSGSVRFAMAPGARGTEVRVVLEYSPPAGRLGRGIAWLFGEEPEQQIKDDLRRFKQLVETGEIPLSDGPGLWRAAQPAERPDDVRHLAGVQR